MSARLSPAIASIFALVLAACASHPKYSPTPAPAAPPTEAPAPPPPPSYTPPPSAPVESGPVPGTLQDFVIHAGDRVYFDLNEYAVRNEAREVLDRQAAWLQRWPDVRVRIEGNCDDRGTVEYNFALGERRAQAVKDYLVSRGVDAGRISTVSYGKEHPIAFGTTEEDYAKNRNAHTALTSGSR